MKHKSYLSLSCDFAHEEGVLTDFYWKDSDLDLLRSGEHHWSFPRSGSAEGPLRVGHDNLQLTCLGPI